MNTIKRRICIVVPKKRQFLHDFTISSMFGLYINTRARKCVNTRRTPYFHAKESKFRIQVKDCNSMRIWKCMYSLYWCGRNLFIGKLVQMALNPIMLISCYGLYEYNHSNASICVNMTRCAELIYCSLLRFDNLYWGSLLSDGRGLPHKSLRFFQLLVELEQLFSVRVCVTKTETGPLHDIVFIHACLTRRQQGEPQLGEAGFPAMNHFEFLGRERYLPGSAY